MLAALIPAAGLSSRMGRYKPLLPLGNSTLIGTVISQFKQAGIPHITVVTGHNHHRLAPAVAAAGASCLFNPDYASGMFSSIRAGVAGLPEGIEGFLLLPVDIPAVRQSTIGRIIETFEGNREALVVPAFEGQTGHPPLVPARLIPAIAGAGPGSNLRQILFPDNGAAGVTVQLPVYDRGILMDADTPEGYEQVRQKFQMGDIPDETECRAIMARELKGSPDIAAHLDRVAQTALTLGRAINSRGAGLNLPLIHAAALLHDVKKQDPRHALAGGRFLQQLGFAGVAHIVCTHMDLVPGPRLDEAQIVYLADKLCQGSRLAPDYPARFHDKAARLPHAGKEILNRLETAQLIHARIESAAGRSLGNILG